MEAGRASGSVSGYCFYEYSSFQDEACQKEVRNLMRRYFEEPEHSSVLHEQSVFGTPASKRREMKKVEEKVVVAFRIFRAGNHFPRCYFYPAGCRRLALAIDSIRENGKRSDYDVVVDRNPEDLSLVCRFAYAEHKSFVPIRKKGKLPRETITAKYDLEYGSAEIEIHKDAIKPGQKVVVVDDLIATGGTTEAIISLIEQLGGEVVKLCFVMELAGKRQGAPCRIQGRVRNHL